MSATRMCPFCAEEIAVAAIRCKHCQAEIPIDPTGGMNSVEAANWAATESDRSERRRNALALALTLGGLCVVGALFLPIVSEVACDPSASAPTQTASTMERKAKFKGPPDCFDFDSAFADRFGYNVADVESWPTGAASRFGSRIVVDADRDVRFDSAGVKKLHRTLRHAACSLWKERRNARPPLGAISVHAYFAGESPSGAYTVGMAELVPNGVWGDGWKPEPYDTWRMVLSNPVSR